MKQKANLYVSLSVVIILLLFAYSLLFSLSPIKSSDRGIGGDSILLKVADRGIGGDSVQQG